MVEYMIRVYWRNGEVTEWPGHDARDATEAKTQAREILIETGLWDSIEKIEARYVPTSDTPMTMADWDRVIGL